MVFMAYTNAVIAREIYKVSAPECGVREGICYRGGRFDKQHLKVVSEQKWRDSNANR